MDTDHTYISMEAEWLPGHDECDDNDDKAILTNLISTETFIPSQCHPRLQQKAKFTMKP